jgi:hypothetical protein
MKFILPVFCTVFLVCICNSNFAQLAKLSIAKEPAWITKNNTDYSRTSLDKDAGDGYIIISNEVQVSLSQQSRYIRSIKKIISGAGVQNGSQVSASFDPSYEQLIFHSISITRDGKSINKLQLSNIKTVHQEKELTNFIYNGSIDAVLILEDVRKGDIIEYSYTIKGFNPIFKNKFTDIISLEFGLPVYNIYYKLLVPPGRKINIKNLNQNIQPVLSTVNGEQVYEWRKSNIAALHIQDYTPSWYDPYASVLLSEFNSWKEVNDWAVELFPLKKELSAGLQKKIELIKTTNATDTDRVKAVLKFVQDDIRYMGIEMGENSHRPANPSKVFAQRFGDCKEKSFLFCCMLNAMNITAAPVLISTSSKKSLYTLLPAPTSFDHVTVRVKLDDAYYYFDPTISFQRGGIKRIFYPDYQAGLVITDTTTALSTISNKNVSTEIIKEHFKVNSMAGAGVLTVTTSYEGTYADNIRDGFNNSGTTELMTGYQKFYAAYFEDIKADSLTYTDDDNTGIFSTFEYYTIPDFWKVDKKDIKKFNFSAFIINDIIRKPKEKDRKMPFSLPYPAVYQENVVIDLPDTWSVEESEDHIKNANFAYNKKFYCIGSHVYLDADFENYKDHAIADETAAYFKDLNEYEESYSYDLTYDPNNKTTNEVKKDTGKSASDIISILIVLGLIIGGITWFARSK